jgi:hypothetical protein
VHSRIAIKLCAPACTLVIVCCSIVAGGCGILGSSPAKLPERHAVVFDQLVFHSDAALPPNHRLLDDLRQLRGRVETSLELRPSEEPVHVYLFSNKDRFHSFLREDFPEFPDRRAFFIKTDTALAVYAHWGDRVAEDLRHEVSHAYMHAVLPDLPLWLDEGLAEYFEVAPGAGGVNQPHVALLKAELASGKWQPDLARLEQIESADQMTQLDYAESWVWAHWMMESAPHWREMLTSYLQSIDREGSAPRLSQQIGRELHDPRPLVVEHLNKLAAG